jgi:hypothetical protein
MSGGLQKSVNVIAAQLIEKVGIQKTIDLAAQMGVTSTLPREFGISLGAADISLYDMIKVYGTLANKGVRPEPVTVLSVINRDGKVLYDYKEELAENPGMGPHVQALNEYQASVMTEMLQNVIDHGTGRKLRYGFGIQGDFAGKTGTTQNQADGWFICYNPQLVTGSWVGAESPAVRFRSMDLGQGSAMALPIVAMFWHKVANDRKLGGLLREKFPDPTHAVQNALGCYPWIGINPDSFNVAMQEQDSTLRDSLVSLYTSTVVKSTEVEEISEEDAQKAEKKEERKEKRNQYEKISKELKASGEEQLSVTDPDSRAVVLLRNIVNVGYNIQSSSDAKHKLLVDYDTGSVNDTHALAPMAIQTKELLQVEHLTVLADKGYHTGEQIERCMECNITTYVSPRGSSTNDKGLYPITDFRYDPQQDQYICPEGETMHTNGKSYQHSDSRGNGKSAYSFKRYTTSACRSCKNKHHCTKGRNGRYIDRSEYAEALESNTQRVLADPDYYRQRQQITEHQFGTFKRQRGFTHTIVRGKEKVMGEVGLMFIGYDLKRCITILGAR